MLSGPETLAERAQRYRVGIGLYGFKIFLLYSFRISFLSSRLREHRALVKYIRLYPWIDGAFDLLEKSSSTVAVFERQNAASLARATCSLRDLGGLRHSRAILVQSSLSV